MKNSRSTFVFIVFIVFLFKGSLSEAESLSWNHTVLEQLILKAVSDYPSVKSKELIQEASRTDLLASKLKFLPTLSFTAAENKISNSSNTAASTVNYNTLSLSLPIFSGGATMAGYQKAKSQLASSDLGLQEAREDVAKKVILAYSDWYRSFLKLNTLEDADASYTRLLDLISRRYEAGISSKSEIDLARSRQNQNRIDVLTQKQLILNAVSTLHQLVGDDIDVNNLNKAIPSYVELPLREDVINQVVEINPTLKRLRFDSEVAESEAKIARAQAFPQLVFQVQKQNGNPYVENAPGMSNYGLVLQYNTDAGFASVATSQSAFTRAQSSITNIETSKRELIQVLQSEYTEYESSKSRLIDMIEADKLSTALSDSYSRQYLAGKKTWMDLMNGLKEKTQNKLAIADVQASLLSSSWKVFIFMNGLDTFESNHE